MTISGYISVPQFFKWKFGMSSVTAKLITNSESASLSVVLFFSHRGRWTQLLRCSYCHRHHGRVMIICYGMWLMCIWLLLWGVSYLFSSSPIGMPNVSPTPPPILWYNFSGSMDGYLYRLIGLNMGMRISGGRYNPVSRQKLCTNMWSVVRIGFLFRTFCFVRHFCRYSKNT